MGSALTCPTPRVSLSYLPYNITPLLLSGDGPNTQRSVFETRQWTYFQLFVDDPAY